MKSRSSIERLTEDLTPVDASAWGAKFLLLILSGFLVLGGTLLLLLHLRADILQVITSGHHLGEFFLLACLSVVGYLQAYRSAFPGRLQSTLYTGLSLVLLALVFALSLGSHESEADLNKSFWSGLSCFIMIGCQGLVLGYLGLRALRRGVFLRPYFSGFCLYSACLATALFTQALVCYKDDSLHLLIWHFGTFLVGSVLGGVYGAKKLRWMST